MPIPGPRSQFGPDEGYRNPGGEQPDRFNLWNRPGPVWWPGRSPGTMIVNLRGNVLGAGQIRKLWRQAVNLIPAQASYSWTANGNIFGPYQGVGITRALRYMTRSLHIADGTDNSRYAALHTKVVKQNVYKTVTVNAGNKRGRPTVRNRVTSFGSRVPTLNQSIQGAESQIPGQATQA